MRPPRASDPAGRWRLGPPAVRNHPWPRRELQFLHGRRLSVARFAWPAPGRASKPRDRPAPPARGDTPLPGRCPDRGAPAALSHPPAASHREQRDRARREPRPGFRSLCRACSGRGDRAVGDRRRRARDVLRGRRLRERRGRADARDCRREQAAHRGCRPPPAARGDDPACRRRADRRVGDRDRPRRGPAVHDRGPRLHGGAPEEGRAERHGEARARPAAAHRRSTRPGRGRHCTDRAGARRDRRLDQQRSGLAPPASRPRSPDRLLDLFVCQLSADPAPPQGLGPRVPGRRVDDRGRPLARVRLRARARQRTRCGSQARDPLPGRARQRLRHLDELCKPILAGEVLDRPLGPRPLLPLRRRRVRGDRAADPQLPRDRSGRGGLGGRRPDAEWPADPRVVPGLRSTSPVRGQPGRRESGGLLSLPALSRARPARVRGPPGRRAGADRGEARRRAADPVHCPGGEPRPGRHRKAGGSARRATTADDRDRRRAAPLPVARAAGASRGLA